MNWRDILKIVHEGANFRLFEFAGTQVTPITLLTLVLLALITLSVSRALQAAVARAGVSGKMKGQQGSVRVAQRLIHYAVLTVGAFVALQGLGIDLGALVAAGAVFAVGVGLAMQSLAQNFVSGVILLLERSIKPGDVVEVDGSTVLVAEMGIRSTECITRDGENLIVPNSLLVQSSVKNFTKGDRSIRVRVPVGVAYGSNMHQVREVLARAAQGIAWRQPGRDSVVWLLGFGSSSVDWEVSVWGEDPWQLPRWRTELSLVVWDALQASGITIAFPQLDVHLDAPVTEGLRALKAPPSQREERSRGAA